MDLSSIASTLNNAKDKLNESGIPEKVANVAHMAKEKINESGVSDKIKNVTANGLDKVASVAETLANKIK